MSHAAFQDIALRQQRFTQALKSGRLTRTDSQAVGEAYAYVYKDGTLGLGRAGAAEPAQADAAAGSIPFTISVYSEDRDGDLVVPMGCYLGNYAKNPVIFLGHQQWEIPIAVSRAPSGQITVFPQKDRIKAIAYFDRADADADFIYGKCQRGILSAASIAFVPIQAVRRDEVEKARTHGEASGLPPGWLFQRYDLTEWSVVGVPSNAGAIRDALDAEKSFLSPKLQKGLRAYAAQTPGCWGGWCPVESTTVSKRCACVDCQEGKACGCKNATQAVADDGAPQHVNPPPGVRPASQRDEEDPLAPRKGRKAMAADSGPAGGYLTEAGQRQANGGSGSAVTETDTPGYEFCPDCNGSGNCPDCRGRGTKHNGQDCGACDGSGECPDCQGAGQIQKGLGTMTAPSWVKEVVARWVVSKKPKKPKKPSGGSGSEDEFWRRYNGALDAGYPSDEAAAIAHSGKSLQELVQLKEADQLDEADLNEMLDQGEAQAEDPAVEAPFSPKASAKVAGALYAHYKAALDYLDQELPGMDNPGMKAYLESHKEVLGGALQHVADGLAEHHPDHDLDKLCKAIEGDAATTNPAADLGLEGEAGAVNAGHVPPPEASLDSTDGAVPDPTQPLNPEDAAGAEPYDDPAAPSATEEAPMATTAPSAADTDPDTEEILERYRHPKSGQMMIRKHRLRRTADGRTYLVRAKEADDDKPEVVTGSGRSAELDEGEQAAPFNKALADDVGAAGAFLTDLASDTAIPKTYRGVAKQHAGRLGAVEKQLTNAGKLQRNGGGGRALTQSGRTQSNSGGGEALSEAGKPQRDGRGRAQVTGAGTPDGLQAGKAPYNKSRTAKQEVQEEFASLKRLFAQITGREPGVED